MAGGVFRPHHACLSAVADPQVINQLHNMGCGAAAIQPIFPEDIERNDPVVSSPTAQKGDFDLLSLWQGLGVVKRSDVGDQGIFELDERLDGGGVHLSQDFGSIDPYIRAIDGRLPILGGARGKLSFSIVGAGSVVREFSGSLQNTRTGAAGSSRRWANEGSQGRGIWIWHQRSEWKPRVWRTYLGHRWQPQTDPFTPNPKHRRRKRTPMRVAEMQTMAVFGWRTIGGARTVGGLRFGLGGGLGEASESSRGWVWGVAKPGGQKESRTAGGTKKRAAGAVLTLERRVKKQKEVAIIVSSQFSRQEGGLTVSEIMDVGMDSGEGIGDDSSGSGGCRETQSEISSNYADIYNLLRGATPLPVSVCGEEGRRSLAGVSCQPGGCGITEVAGTAVAGGGSGGGGRGGGGRWQRAVAGSGGRRGGGSGRWVARREAGGRGRGRRRGS
ncbi:hypothetical protein C8J57DRAFT_1236705 [Mycena rebaudengoi]|nr:hypothetical protein C8J57DRAFT_1236705 [Mycena rebaudengoi]